MRMLARLRPLLEVAIGIVCLFRNKPGLTATVEPPLTKEEIEHLREWIQLLRDMEAERDAR